jgi:hypothetical protein
VWRLVDRNHQVAARTWGRSPRRLFDERQSGEWSGLIGVGTQIMNTSAGSG